MWRIKKTCVSFYSKLYASSKNVTYVRAEVRIMDRNFNYPRTYLCGFWNTLNKDHKK